ncbi:hypothetical protein CH370_09155 [Leptospira kmetyi]|uniref:hypothetical protein n=1 Tax=Leptospira kmetyi TaxID=408139 RepID=UPI000C29E369|nr:hypothetical protein [Leptospira kmetyi]PJZ41606.1 hypothetical protein CH370_09155 [Leptospira kmetyi]
MILILLCFSSSDSQVRTDSRQNGESHKKPKGKLIESSDQNTKGNQKRTPLQKNKIDGNRGVRLAGNSKDFSNDDDDDEEADLLQDTSMTETKRNQSEDEDEDEEIIVNVELMSDFVFRGNTFGSESISQRDNVKYSSFLPAYTFQPSIEIPITKRLTLEFWFNLFLTHKGDRDSDQRFLQAGPGEPELLNYYQPYLNQGVLPFDPRSVHQFKEENGLKWDDGGEILADYKLSESKFGKFSTGFFSYNAFLPKNRFSWTQVYIAWEIPFLTYLNPKLSFFKTTDPGNDSPTTGINKGWGYIPFELSHEFKITQKFKITPTTSAGYIIRNNPQDNLSGFSDITSNLKLEYDGFYLTANMAYRPNLEIYDSSYFFDNITTSDSMRDGRTIDPSKQYGALNNSVRDVINRNFSDPLVQKFILENYQSQHIKREIYYFSFGYSKGI